MIMENKDNIQELETLKNQMAILKEHLNKCEIIDDEQIMQVTKQYCEPKAKSRNTWSILTGLVVCMPIIYTGLRYSFSLCKWGIIFLAMALSVTFQLLVNGARKYKIVNGSELKISSLIKTTTIPIADIMYIEHLKRKYRENTLRIKYNGGTPILIGPKDETEFISDLVRLNPNILVVKECI